MEAGKEEAGIHLEDCCLEKQASRAVSAVLDFTPEDP